MEYHAPTVEEFIQPRFTKGQFVYAVNNSNHHTLTMLDKMFCGCGYVWHWVENMSRGTWNPNLNEMDHELRDVHTPEELYEFLISKV